MSSLIFAFGGIPAYFNIQAEMKDPRLYTRSLILCQSTVSAVYITIGIVVYYFCGSYVASPALGSAGHEMKKVCYGVALPGLFVSTILTTHVSLLGRSWTSRTVWLTVELATGQVHLYSYPSREQAHDREHRHSLGNLDRMHLRHDYCGLCDRERHPCF